VALFDGETRTATYPAENRKKIILHRLQWTISVIQFFQQSIRLCLRGSFYKMRTELPEGQLDRLRHHEKVRKLDETKPKEICWHFVWDADVLFGFLQPTGVYEVKEHPEDIRVVVFQGDRVAASFFEALIEESIEVGRCFAKQIWVNAVHLDRAIAACHVDRPRPLAQFIGVPMET
jgi:hypothetical protein